jgi:hypothetical protein
MKQRATAASLVLVALVIGLAVLAGTGMAQEAPLDLSSVCEPGELVCIGTLRSVTAGNSSDAGTVKDCCFGLLHSWKTKCFCDVARNQEELGIDLPKVCSIESNAIQICRAILF